jgi:EAL domain-containing protein (putative c-di-GMP-specific phosphodiesterase class I)
VAHAGDGRPADLLRDATTAMHRAKENSSGVELFDPAHSQRAKERLRLESELFHALERGELFLHFQPIIALHSGALSGFEALMRWRRGERGLVRPDLFIPIAEENGLILELGRWALAQACRTLMRWREACPESRALFMAVNLSARQFDDPELLEEVTRSLGQSGLDPGSLKLEVTESVIMARTRENAARLAALKELGVRLAIDDFGTGYSSLASLHSFPIDTMKVDRAFVSRMEFEEQKAEIVRTILTLARKLEMDAVAEGVETQAELAMLRELGCEHGQGYLFSPAIDEAAALEWIRRAPRW